MGHLGVVLYEYLGEEYPEVLGSILGALKAIVNVIGMTRMTPPIKDLLPRLTPILKNRFATGTVLLGYMCWCSCYYGNVQHFVLAAYRSSRLGFGTVTLCSDVVALYSITMLHSTVEW